MSLTISVGSRWVAGLVGALALLVGCPQAFGASVYVGNGTTAGSIAQYSAGAGGALTALAPPTIVSGSLPEKLAVSPNGANVYAPNASSNTVSQYSVAAGGTLTPLTPATVSTGASPGSIVVDPNEFSAYVLDIGANAVSQYSIASGGALSPLPTPTVATGAGSQFIAVSPDGKSVYVTNASANTVSEYSVGADGTLSPMTPATVATPSFPEGVVVSPNGKFAYVGNNGGTISQYAVGTGGVLSSLTPATITSGATNVRQIAISPDGNSVYVPGTAATPSVFQFDVGATGLLTAKSPASVASGVTGSVPGVAVSADGKNLYLVASNKVAQFAVGATGLLTALSPATFASASPTVSGIAVSPLPSVGVTSLATTASDSVLVGAQISASAVLSGGLSPTGTVTFNLYGAGDTSCSTSLATSTATVSGNGPYSSAAFTTATPGVYTWTASYGGDGGNSPAGPTSCSNTAAQVAVTAPGEITGTVTNGSGTPLANICVYPYASGASGARTSDSGVCTNASGGYTLTLATAGSYNLAFFDPSGTYVTQWYSGASSESTATAVSVSTNAITSGVNATMSGQTAISGTVTNGSGTPLANICVYLYAAGASGARTGDAGTCTTSNGTYSMAVGSPGSYNVVFVDPSGTYLTQWYTGASSEATATTVSVAGGTPTTGVNVTMTQPTQITGTVTNSSGSPVSNICVYLYGSGASGVRTGDAGTCTNSSGQYVLGVASPGSYNLVFYDPSGTYLTQWYNGAATESSATPVTVMAGAQTSGINAMLGGPTQISGTVTNGSGTPLSNICAYLYASGATGARTGDTGTCTNASGQYSMAVGSPGSYNVVFVDPSGTYLTQWNSGASSEATATAVTVTGGSTTTVNATMTAPTQITGTVTNASGTPLSNICVYLYASGATGTRTGDTGTCTNAAGQYTMSVAAAGAYNVVFYDPNNVYVTQWYNGETSEVTANPITVTSGATTPNINATIQL